MGLGQYPAVTLAQAREKARQARQLIEQGIDPILERETAQSTLKAKQAAAITFTTAAHAYIDSKSAEWRNAKHRAQWSSTFEAYAFPIIGQLHVADIKQTHILKILEPIWVEKTTTAARLRGRLENVLDWAKARGYRTDENPARWRGHLDKILSAPKKTTKIVHHPAVPIHEIAAFYADLKQRAGMAARALEFALLTAARSGEVRGATWSELDLDLGLWVIPASRMKANREHRVPLSEAALELLHALPRLESSEYLFPNLKGTPLSDMALAAVMRRMGLKYVPHGLRSTFRDWTAEKTAYPRDLAEKALAHVLESKVEEAYQRSDMLERRAHMMQGWSVFLATPAATCEKVLLLKRRAA